MMQEELLMRILFTNTGAWGTGSGTVVDGVIDQLMGLGHRVNVFFPDSEFVTDDMREYYGRPEIYKIWRFPLQRDGVKLYTFPLIISDPHPRNYPDAWTFRDLSEQQLSLYLEEFRRKIYRLIGQFRPDIIECQHIWAMDHVILELGYPYICVAHHSDQMGFRRDHRMRDFAIRSACGAEFIFAISEMVREEVLELYPVPEEKVVVIGNGYDQHIFRRKHVDREKLLAKFGLDIPPRAPIITFAGKLSRTKGIDILLMANRWVQQRRDAHFVIFGAGAVDETLDQENLHLYSDRNVHFMGHQTADVLASFHNIAWASVMPSRTEGFGISALEAMGCGVPMVVTRTGGPDQFAVGEVIEPEDPQALADALLNLLDLSTEEHSRLQREAHATARVFSWQKIAKTRIAYYRRVLRGEGMRRSDLGIAQALGSERRAS